jgi:16S rRNA (cytidine1402-2'-O)-methyltransferase
MTGMMMETSTTPAALYVVATPIGNLGDISQRALDTLRGVALIACEDTRHAHALLDHYGIHTQTMPLHEHNEAAAAARLVETLRAGRAVALISDAGTPAISDPGARACAAARAAGFRVVPLPGPNAAIAALSASGLSDTRFLFAGFLPPKSAARRREIEALKGIPAALVFHEAPHRIEETVADLAALLEPERTLVFARELTKLFEQIAAMPLHEASAWLAADENHRRGEFVLIVSAPPPATGLNAETERVLKTLLAELPVKQAAKLAAEITGAAKNALYERALQLTASCGHANAHAYPYSPRRLAPAPARWRGHGRRAAAHRRAFWPRHRHAQLEAAYHHHGAGIGLPRTHPRRAARWRAISAVDDALPHRPHTAR